jgi:hypothetical protein
MNRRTAITKSLASVGKFALAVIAAPTALLASPKKTELVPKHHVINWQDREDGSSLLSQSLIECSQREWGDLQQRDPQYKFWVTHRLDSSTAGSDERLIALSPQRLAPEVQAHAESVRRKRAERLRDKSASIASL